MTTDSDSTLFGICYVLFVMEVLLILVILIACAIFHYFI